MNKLKQALFFLKTHLNDDKETLFPLTLILNSLKDVNCREAQEIKQKIATILLKEKSDHESFNYWLQTGKKFDKEPYPDDLDDTFCAWLALLTYDSKLVTSEVLLKLTKLLLFNQLKIGGPYFTWVVDVKNRQKWSNIDFVVNVNIARFLATQKVNVKGLQKYIDGKIKHNDFNSSFYKGELASLYFLSYFYRGKQIKKIKEKIKLYLAQRLEQGNLLLIAIIALKFNFKDLLNEYKLTELFYLQKNDGGAKAFDFYNYTDVKQLKKYYASSALSTAFFIEYLTLCKKFREQEKYLNLKLFLQKRLVKQSSIFSSDKSQKIIQEKAFKVIFSKHSDLALFLPNLLSLDLSTKTKINQSLLNKLSMINLYAWIAYTIYDDLNDNEGKITDLPIANLCLQSLFLEVSRLPKSEIYLPKLCRLLNIMEQNFLLEKDKLFLNRAKEKDIIALSYRKSIGQIFGVYYFLEYYHLVDKKLILEIMRCLLLLKQINDDLHDCFRDFSKGQINSVNYFLIKEDFDKHENKKQKIIFYQKTAPLIYNKMDFYLRKAKNLLRKQKLLKQDNYFKKILSYYEKLIVEGQRERQNLLNYYRGSSP